MNDSVVFIRKEGFLAGTIKSALENSGYEVYETEPEIKSIRALIEKIDIIVILLGKFPPKDDIFYQDLTFICRNGKSVFVLGEKEQMDDFRQVFEWDLVKGEFLRPFNTSQLVALIGLEQAEREQSKFRKEILIIDDDPIFLHAIKEHLLDVYAVSIVSNGMDGIKYLAFKKPDLILLDYEMPVVDGATVLGMLRENEETKDIPVIFLTGKGDKESVMKVVSLSPQGYLLKSSSFRRVHQYIDDYFGKESENTSYDELYSKFF